MQNDIRTYQTRFPRFAFYFCNRAVASTAYWPPSVALQRCSIGAVARSEVCRLFEYRAEGECTWRRVVLRVSDGRKTRVRFAYMSPIKIGYTSNERTTNELRVRTFPFVFAPFLSRLPHLHSDGFGQDSIITGCKNIGRHIDYCECKFHCSCGFK